MNKSEIRRRLASLLGCADDDLIPMMEYLDTLSSSAEIKDYLLNLVGKEQVTLIDQICQALSKHGQAVFTRSSTSSASKSASSISQQNRKQATSSNAPQKRELCYCMGLEHGLFTNCLSCGKVVCQREGAGPCLFCAATIQPDGRTIISGPQKQQQQQSSSSSPQTQQQQQQSKASKQKQKGVKVDLATLWASAGPAPSLLAETEEQRRRRLQMEDTLTSKNINLTAPKESNEDPKLRAAKELRDRLINYDKSDAVRSRIHDNSEDYRSADTDIWLSPAERALAKKNQLEYERLVEEEKRKILVSLDVRTGKLVQESPKKIANPVSTHSSHVSMAKPDPLGFIDPTIHLNQGPVQFVPTGKHQLSPKRDAASHKQNKKPIVQRDEKEQTAIISYASVMESCNEPDWEE